MTAEERLRSLAKSQNWLKPALRAISRARCRAWDLFYRVDTCGEIPLLDLNFKNEHKTAGLEYQSHHPGIIRDGLRSLGIRYEDYSFIDFGCGKGRVLLIASEFPFRRITGLEFAPQLAECARQNLKTYRGRKRRCCDIETVTGDATEYELPPEPQLLYFYSPFAPSVLREVINNIDASLQRRPRELLVLFSGIMPMRDLGFGARPQYERLQRTRYYDLYRYRCQTPL